MRCGFPTRVGGSCKNIVQPGKRCWRHPQVLPVRSSKSIRSSITRSAPRSKPKRNPKGVPKGIPKNAKKSIPKSIVPKEYTTADSKSNLKSTPRGNLKSIPESIPKTIPKAIPKDKPKSIPKITPETQSSKSAGSTYIISGFRDEWVFFIEEKLKKLGMREVEFADEVGYLHLTKGKEPVGPKKIFVYDKRMYKVRAFVQQVFDSETKKGFAVKHLLHRDIKGPAREFTKNGPFVAKSKFISRSAPLSNAHYVEGVYIFRPSGFIYGAGDLIYYASSEKSFENIRQKYAKLKIDPKIVLVSEVFVDPLLFEGRKFHLRFYLLVVSEYGNIPFHIEFAKFGKLLTAEQPYENKHWDDLRYHDTHVHSTPVDLYYPDDFPDKKLIPGITKQLEELRVQLIPLTRKCRPYPTAKSCFEVFGVDLMVMRNGDLKLIEINDQVGYATINPEDPKTIRFVKMMADWQFEEALFPLLKETGAV